MGMGQVLRRDLNTQSFSHADGGPDGAGPAETEHYPRPVGHEDADALPRGDRAVHGVLVLELVRLRDREP